VKQRFTDAEHFGNRPGSPLSHAALPAVRVISWQATGVPPQRGQYRFTVKEGATGRPSIAGEPTGAPASLYGIALGKDASARKFDVVMAWSVDRLGRSLRDLVGFLAELHALKIDLCLRQQGIDTTTPAGKALFGMMGVFAEFERSIIQERVRAGLERARREGKRLGRPPLAPKLLERIQEALSEPGRPGVRKIAERFGVNASTVQQISSGL
jgi:hypothetical protein